MMGGLPEILTRPVPKDLDREIEYWTAATQRWPDNPHFKRHLRNAKERKSLAHNCICCGKLLTRTPGEVGPECAGHWPENPCRRREFPSGA